MNPFNSFAEFLQVAYRNTKSGIKDERLITSKAAGLSEGVAAEGGFTVGAPIVGPVLESAQQKSLLWSKAVKLQTNSYGAKVPRLAESTRSDSMTGKMAYWIGEGVSKTTDYPRWTQSNKKLNKLCVLLPITDELMQDSKLLQDWIDGFVTQRIAWVVDRAILYGDFSTSMNGIMGPAGCDGVKYITEADPLDAATLENFEAALAPANENLAEWYMSKENFIDIMASAQNLLQNNKLVFIDEAYHLYGHKINVMECMSAKNGDLVLGDFSNYFVLSMGDAIKYTSIQFRFDTDQTYIRWVIRLNGDSFGQVYTTEDGSSVAPFVVPDNSLPVQSSSSSSSSMGKSNSSASTDTSQSISSSSSKSISSSSSSDSTDASASTESSSESSLGYSASTESSSMSTEVKTTSSTSSSSSQSGACPQKLCASGFSTTAYNGTYNYAGLYNNAKSYKNANNWYIWFDTVTTYWVLSNTKGDPQNQWKSTTDTTCACPDDDIWVSEDGVVSAGAC